MNFDFQQPAIFTAGENLEGKGTGGLVLNQAYRSHVFPEARTNPRFSSGGCSAAKSLHENSNQAVNCLKGLVPLNGL